MTPPYLVMPLDARPVCYDQVLDMAAIGRLPVVMPPKTLLGTLKVSAPLADLETWWRGQLVQTPAAAIILALDLVTYGGLIPSRLNDEDEATLIDRSQRFLSCLGTGHHPRYGFSSILRIPTYNNAEEEPDYWADYGALLYRFSVETHQQGSMPRDMFNKIPGVVIQDFMLRRQKNFNVNKRYLEVLQAETLDYLVYCQDDTGPMGLNVKEALALQDKIKAAHLQSRVLVQTGADELALTLLARALWAQEPQPIKVFPWVFPDHGRKVLAKFDGIPVGNVVQRQMQTLGAVACLSPRQADLVLMVNAPSDQMGDHAAQQVALRPKTQVQELLASLRQVLPEKDVALADVVYANGADPVLMHQFFETETPFNKLSGYAAWNTPGNSIGGALAMGAVVAWARRHQCLEETAWQKLLLKRFLDDWYYQAEVRLRMRKQETPQADPELLRQWMQPGVDKLQTVFRLPSVTPHFSFPCHRLFEIAVDL